MDSITHLALGACLGAALAPPARRRAGALVGALLNSAPDLDLIVVGWLEDPVFRMSDHRSASHSILVLPLVALALWWIARRISPVVREAPGRWLALIVAALVAHPLLDACTVYGTQLLWPLERPPAMLGLLFIVDPLFTLPLIAGTLVAWRSRDAFKIAWWSRMGLATSAVYLAWAAIAHVQVEQNVRAFMDSKGLVRAPILVEPAPLTTLLWRVLVMRPDGAYYEGHVSFLALDKPLVLDPFPSTPALLAEIDNSPDVQRLRWFTRGFFSVRPDGDRVLITDLRMGAEPDYLFVYEVGLEKDGRTVALDPPVLRPWIRFRREQLALVWRRLFEPHAAGSTG